MSNSSQHPYKPTTSTDWGTQPTTGQQADDLLAARVKVLEAGGGGSSIYTDKQSLNGVSTKTFTVPAGYFTLRFIVTGATQQAALQDNPFFRLNGLSTGIYSAMRQYAFGTTNTADETLGTTSWGSNLVGLPGTTAQANTSGFVDITIYDYANTTFRKTGKFRGRQPFSTTSTNGYTMHGVLQADLTAAITSISVTTTSGANFTNGSVAELILMP